MKNRASGRLWALCVAGTLACTSSADGVHSRFAAVHNTMVSLGMNQLGHLSEGSLPEGGAVNLPLDLEAQCYTFVAFGGHGARDVDLSVLDANNNRVAGDSSRDPQAAVRWCARVRGRYTLALRMASGSGSYLVGTWQGGASSGGSGPTESTEGTCLAPLPIQPGQSVSGSTAGRGARHTGQCGRGYGGYGRDDDDDEEPRGGAPEVVYSFTLERRQQVNVTLETSGRFDGVLYLRGGTCDAPSSEVACNDDDGDINHSRVVTALDPGQYFIFVDGYGNDRGNYTLTLNAQDIPSVAEICQNATPLAPNTPVTAQLTAQDFNIFSARCGGGARGGERVYRLEVPQESRLQLHLESDYDAVLHLRRACGDPGSEVACNDDAEDIQHARINTVVPAGTYYVFSDAYRPGVGGDYTLEADLAPVVGGSTPGDTCADAVPLTPGTPVEGNTFLAHDDLQSPCAAPSEGYDVVYRLNVATRSRVKLWLEGSELGNQGTITVTRNCGQLTGATCRPGAVSEATAYNEVLTPGQYFVIVDSAAPRRFGRFRLQARVEDPAAAEMACRSARPLVSGRAVTGDTSGGTDRFQASCAGGARNPENLYRLTLPRRSRVRLALSAQYDAALYIRQNCMDPATERACNDDSTDPQHSLIETVLPAGTYTVFVDGYGRNNAGQYTLETQISAP